jgi:membrane protease YdiL (CAAX protease family)
MLQTFFEILNIGKDQALALAQGIGQIAFMLLPAIIVMKWSPLKLEDMLRFKSSITPLQWVLGIIGVVVLQSLAQGHVVVLEHSLPISWWEEYTKILYEMEQQYNRLLGGSTSTDVLQGLVLGAVIPAIAEEVLFRGFLQRSLEEIHPPTKAIIITSLVFATVHFNPIAFVPLALIGCFLGYCAYHTQSLALPIVIHFFNNALAVVFMYLPDEGSSELSKETTGIAEGTFIFMIGLTLLFGIVYLLNTRTPRYMSDKSSFVE